MDADRDRNAGGPGRGALGLFDRPAPRGLSHLDIIALALSALWLVLAGLVLWLWPGGMALVHVLAIVMPLGLIWIAVSVARASKALRRDSDRLRAALEAVRHIHTSQQQTAQTAVDKTIARKLDEIAVSLRKTQTELAQRPAQMSPRPAQEAAPGPQSPSAPPDEVQSSLAFDLQTPAEPLPSDEFIRALNFPETAEDTAGFAALRRAMKDHKAAQLVQAAQDILTLLSQDGIYMDDLRPDRAKPEIWRQFGNGARGKPIAALGGIHDSAPLGLAAKRMKQDPIFRDVAHHFLRRFDQTFATFAETASDGEISALAETRTARAFMLLGRVAGTFD